jgi:hypothetical protein
MRRDRKQARARASALDQTVLQRRGDQKADGDGHDRKGGDVQTLRQRREIPEAALEGGIEMKAQQDLGAEDQEPRFIERRLDPFVVGTGHGSSSRLLIPTSVCTASTMALERRAAR